MQSFNLSGKQEVERQLLETHVEDIQPNTNDDIPEEFTIVVKPNEQILQKIYTLIQEFKAEFPEQNYYTSQQMHFTLIGGLNPKEISQQDIESALAEFAPLFPITLQIEDLGTSPYVVSTIGYPPDDNVHLLREKLRSKLGIGTDYTAIKPFWEHLMWLNFIRYNTKPTKVFLERLQQYHNIKFGELTLDKVYLYRNTSKTLKPQGATLIKEFSV